MKETAARSAATSHWFVTGPASNATPAARLAAAADASQGSPGPSLPAGTAVMRQKLGVRLHGRTPFFVRGCPVGHLPNHLMSIHPAPALSPWPAFAAASFPPRRRRIHDRVKHVLNKPFMSRVLPQRP